MQIHRVDTRRCMVGEGALWYADEQALYFLDITGRKVHRYDPAAGTTRSWETPSAVGAMALRQRGGAVVAMKDAVWGLDLATGDFAPIAQLEGAPARATFNDGKVDRRGRFAIGLCDSDMSDPQPIGGLYSLGADQRFRELDRGIHFSNSPCWSPDGATLYFSDSLKNAVYAYDYDLETGAAANRRLFADTTALGGMPDGATTDRDGLVWMAIFRAGKVVAFRPDGRVEREVAMPVRLAVSVAFGGANLDQLYVTTIDPSFFGEPAQAGGGEVYVIEGLGVRGVPEPRFAG
ncbi:SMP-30/gluconolactonase/LRE family protein [Phenylobacterium sp. LjRoot219]|uniref:SMP-30/gluconolactonase/LRE family protein n=1 Tax=Phenylobacterium sp. LjRoot219 TaxID=3342283 RepID=UPI003ECEA1CD